MGLWDTLRLAWQPITERVAPVTEAVGQLGYDPDEGHTAAQVGSAYARRLSGQHPKRDLTPIAADKARDTAANLYVSHGLGKRIIDIYRDWIVGTGMTVEVEPDQADIDRRDRKPALGPDGEPLREAEPPAATAPPAPPPAAVPNEISGRAKRRQRERQDRLDAFWNDPSNKLDQRLREHVATLCLFGELLMPVAVNPVNGHVKLGVIDPGQIKCVILDPFAGGLPAAVDLKSTPDNPRRLKVIRIDEDPDSPTYGRRIGPKPGETYRDDFNQAREYIGGCFLWQINKVPTAERGNSDLTCVIDYLDSLDEMHFGEMDRSTLAKSFVFDVTLTGATQDGIDKRRAELRADKPKPGSVNVHNEQELWAVNSPALNAWDYQALVEVIWNHIAAATGLPKHWISSTIDVNKATATEMAEPTIKTLETRQRLVIEVLQEVCAFALDQAELAGRISKRRSAPGQMPTAWPLKVVAPEIRTRDTATAAKALTDTATAVTTLMTAGVLDAHAAQDILMSPIDNLGAKVDMETVRERLAAAKVEQQQQDEQARDAETAAQVKIKKAAPPAAMRRAG